MPEDTTAEHLAAVDEFVAAWRRMQELGLASPRWCATHEGPPYTEDEDALIDAEGDLDVVCVDAIRLW